MGLKLKLLIHFLFGLPFLRVSLAIHSSNNKPSAMNVKTMSINSQMGEFKEGFYLCLRVRVYLNFLSDLLLTFNTMKCVQNLWKWVPACSDVHIHPVHRTDGLLLVHISAVSHMRTAAAKGLKVGSRNPDQSLKTALCGRHTKNEELLNCNVSFTNISYYYCHYYVLSWFKILLFV